MIGSEKMGDRRLFPRHGCRTEVVFEDEFGDGLFYVYSRDISLGGIFLDSEIPLKLGTLLFVSFHLPPHKRPVRATAEVVRHTGAGGAQKDSAVGMGVRFVGLSQLARRRLEEFIG